eukprot:COSAG01_NODE_614_length_14830_cov_87.820572_12_plen_178_part_00
MSTYTITLCCIRGRLDNKLVGMHCVYFYCQMHSMKLFKQQLHIFRTRAPPPYDRPGHHHCECNKACSQCIPSQYVFLGIDCRRRLCALQCVHSLINCRCPSRRKARLTKRIFSVRASVHHRIELQCLMAHFAVIFVLWVLPCNQFVAIWTEEICVVRLRFGYLQCALCINFLFDAPF